MLGILRQGARALALIAGSRDIKARKLQQRLFVDFFVDEAPPIPSFSAFVVL
jgi:hypothetical protein